MEISIPFVALLKKLLEKLDQFLFLETFETSNNEYLKSKTFLKDWIKLPHDIEISYDLPSILDNARVPSMRLAIRTSSNIIIDKIVLRIEAKSGIRYQEAITLYDISNTPIISSLPSIPLRNIDFDEKSRIYQSVRKLNIYLQEIIINEASLTIDSSKHISYPTNFDLLNTRFTHRWGVYWNLYEIDSEINHIQKKAQYYLITPKKLYARKSEIPTKEKFKNICRVSIGLLIYLLFCNKYMCKFWFWFKIIVLRRKFKIRE